MVVSRGHLTITHISVLCLLLRFPGKHQVHRHQAVDFCVQAIKTLRISADVSVHLFSIITPIIAVMKISMIKILFMDMVFLHSWQVTNCIVLIVSTVEDALKFYHGVLHDIKSGHSKNSALKRSGKHLVSLHRVEALCQLSILRPAQFEQVN
jgi:hypothetical protein